MGEYYEYAINIADLHEQVERERAGGCFSPLALLLGPLLTGEVVECEPGRLDGAGLRVRRELAPERWAAALSIVRRGLGQRPGIPRHRLRIYRRAGRSGHWRRL